MERITMYEVIQKRIRYTEFKLRVDNFRIEDRPAFKPRLNKLLKDWVDSIAKYTDYMLFINSQESFINSDESGRRCPASNRN